MKKIGICVIVNESWLGGINYFLSLLLALDQHPSQEHEYYVLTNRSDLFSHGYKSHIKIIQCEHLTDNSERIRKLRRHFQTNITLAYYSRRYQLDLITYAIPGKRLLPPTLYWMPDFQHCCLPHLFSEAELNSRNQAISMAAERSGHLLLSSAAAERDFRQFYPQYSSVQTHVLCFVPYIREQDINYHQKLLVQSQTEEDFFYLPNQFWAHKNHAVVLDALAMLPAEIKVVCTGNLSDYRNKAYIGHLLHRIKTLGLEKRFIVLGQVERSKMMSLMFQALAIINPSLFEGWSTTVEEAKYTGKKIILSDLPVHREQSPADAIYFGTQDPAALATAMLQVWQHKGSERQLAVSRFTQAKISLAQNRALFADKYQTIVSAMLEKV
ncbi:glycosyltransferase family 4 protein [Rheinheimera aquimaris]|uniref:glycosyltransferase family 4 protein n=1 Tax=Rheinheimera aquimaris TaxID=412437 RepID=UPI001E35F479|nr:glycosyltransferase family 1 protein [Rheinheimera aquimaris]MCD1599748.1 glycosyltransferase family 4 protein [Rheinheimera aquimaris]